MQKQPHFESRAYVSHSSKKKKKVATATAKTYARKTLSFTNCSSEYPELFLGPCRAERPLHAPPPLRPGHFHKARCWLAQPVAVCATGSYSCYTSGSSSTGDTVSVRWVWRGHLDPIHVRNVRGVQLRASPLVLRTVPGLDSHGQHGRRLTNH